MESKQSDASLVQEESSLKEIDANCVEKIEHFEETSSTSTNGVEEYLVMACDKSNDKQPQQVDAVIQNDAALIPAYIESTKNAIVQPANDSEATITKYVECDVELPAKIIETNIETNISVETPSGGSEGAIKEHKLIGTSIVDPNRLEKSDEKTSDSSLEDSAPEKPVGSLGLLAQYNSSSDEDEDENDPSSSENVIETNLNAMAKDLFDRVMSNGIYREVDDEDGTNVTESDESDSDIEYVGEIDPETIDITNEDKAFLDSCDDNTAPKGPIRAKGEFDLNDLPPIADLTITVPESECIQLGTVSGIVGTLVLVESLPNFAAVDIDTVLFLDKGNRTLGQVFDVMGNVASPIYCVRFNNAQDIVDKQIKAGLIIYVAPKTEHTNFIVLSELMNQRGTDASWEDDIEPPNGCGDFSDDEEERLARRTKNQQQRNRNRTSISSDAGDVLHPVKITVKQEASDGKQRGRNHRNHKMNRNNGKPEKLQFYKDNRDYDRTAPNHMNYYQVPMRYDHSWHTAGMIPPQVPSSTSGMPSVRMPMMPGCYPNPFAMASNQPMSYFNLQAFPPLPPPMSMQQSPTTHSQRNRRPNNRYGVHSNRQ